MLSLLRPEGARHLPRTLGAAGAAAAVAASMGGWTEQEENQPRRKEDVMSSPKGLGSRILPRPSTTHCDAAFMGVMEVPRLGMRKSTVVKLRELSEAKDGLETKYRVLWEESLGEGASGTVFRAVDRRTGENVAVKKIPKKIVDSITFQREMDALILLKEKGGHPNICGMRESYEESDHFYIVMDLVRGREMFEQLCCEGAYSEADAARHIREVASALNFLHGIGIVHSDLKPENVMLSSNNSADAVVKLVDLGCAHLDSNPPHKTKIIANTPAYCPPEVLLEENTCIAKNCLSSFDMWSLGILIYIMLVGGHPFDLKGSGSDDEVEQRILSGKKPPLRGYGYADHLSEDAMALIEGLIEWDPQKRMTAEQVLKNSWVQGETATSKKIADSDKRLAAYRKYKTRIGSTFFRALLSQTDAIQGNKSTERTSVLESAFRRLDTRHKGYISPHDMSGDSSESDRSTELSFSDISFLLSENMKNRYFGKDQTIYTEGDCGDSMYLIDSGTVEVTTKDGGFKKNRESGEIIGVDVMMSSNTTHSNTARCLTPVHVLEIPRELLEKYVTSDKESFLRMTETAGHQRRERANTILRLKEGCEHSYGKGEVIFHEGEKGDKLYVLVDGGIDLSLNGLKVRSLQKGELTGEHAAYHGKPYNVTAQCVSNVCQVQSLSSKSIHCLFRNDESLREDFRDFMLRRDFKKALVVVSKRPFPSTEGEIRATFDAVDLEQTGEITFDKLRSIVRQFDPSYNESDIRDMLASLDLNKSGSLTWEEFRHIFSMDKEA